MRQGCESFDRKVSGKLAADGRTDPGSRGRVLRRLPCMVVEGPVAVFAVGPQDKPVFGMPFDNGRNDSIDFDGHAIINVSVKKGFNGAFGCVNE